MANTEGYFCEKCGYVTQYKQCYERHLARKTTCNRVDILSIKPSLDDIKPSSDGNKQTLEGIIQCKGCKKTFKSDRNLRIHKKTCKGVENTVCPTCFKKFSNNQGRNKHCRLVKCSPPKVTADQVSSHTQNIQTQQNAQTINNTTNNITFSFGKENIDYLTNDEVNLIKAIRSGEAGLQDMIQQIYFNKEHPENNTVQLPNMSRGMIQVREGEKWKYKPSESVTYAMMYKAAMPLHMQYVKQGERHKKFEAVRQAIQTSDQRPREKRSDSTPEDKKILRKLVKDTQCTIINNRKKDCIDF